MRGRGDQAACRASPWTLHSPTLHSSINYTNNISITDMRGSSALLHHDIRKHFLIFSFNLSLMNSIWTNFRKINKRKKIGFFSGFTLSNYLHRDLPANLMKVLYQGNFFKQIKKQVIFVLTSLINQTHPLSPYCQVQSAIMFISKGNSTLAPLCDLQGTCSALEIQP